MGNPHPVNAGKGRPIKGSKNKKTAEVREAARVYTNEALLAFVRLMRGQNVKGKSRSEVLPQTQDREWAKALGDGLRFLKGQLRN